MWTRKDTPRAVGIFIQDYRNVKIVGKMLYAPDIRTARRSGVAKLAIIGLKMLHS